MNVPAWKRGLQFLNIIKEGIPAAVHSVVVHLVVIPCQKFNFIVLRIVLYIVSGSFLSFLQYKSTDNLSHLYPSSFSYYLIMSVSTTINFHKASPENESVFICFRDLLDSHCVFNFCTFYVELFNTSRQYYMFNSFL